MNTELLQARLTEAKAILEQFTQSEQWSIDHNKTLKEIERYLECYQGRFDSIRISVIVYVATRYINPQIESTSSLKQNLAKFHIQTHHFMEVGAELRKNGALPPVQTLKIDPDQIFQQMQEKFALPPIIISKAHEFLKQLGKVGTNLQHRICAAIFLACENTETPIKIYELATEMNLAANVVYNYYKEFRGITKIPKSKRSGKKSSNAPDSSPPETIPIIESELPEAVVPNPKIRDKQPPQLLTTTPPPASGSDIPCEPIVKLPIPTNPPMKNSTYIESNTDQKLSPMPFLPPDQKPPEIRNNALSSSPNSDTKLWSEVLPFIEATPGAQLLQILANVHKPGHVIHRELKQLLNHREIILVEFGQQPHYFSKQFREIPVIELMAIYTRTKSALVK